MIETLGWICWLCVSRVSGFPSWRICPHVECPCDRGDEVPAGKLGKWTSPATCWHLQNINYIYILYCPVVFITKLSILVQLLHIFAPTRTGVNFYLCHFMIWFNFLFYTAIFFVAIFICNPRAKFWNPALPGKCVDINSVNIITSVINAVSDLVLLLLPIICVSRLQMDRRKKLGVIAVFATASLWV